jgi:hypothetical protein
VTASLIPPTAVVRVSRGNVDPARFPEVDETTVATVSYLVPAGHVLLHARVSPVNR